MSHSETFYGRRCRSPIGLSKVGESSLLGPELIYKTLEILQSVDKVAYELTLASELALIHSVFRVSMLKKCIGYPESIVYIEGLDVQENLSYEEVSFEILYRQVKKLTNKEVASVKVIWKNHLVEGATWDVEVNKKSIYPHLFDKKRLFVPIYIKNNEFS